MAASPKRTLCVESGGWYRLRRVAGSDPGRDVTVRHLNKHIYRLEALIDG